MEDLIMMQLQTRPAAKLGLVGSPKTFKLTLEHPTLIA